MRQSELLGLMVEKRGSNEIAEDTADEKRPVGIKQILDNNIKPNKEEYVELNDLDRRKNHSQFSKAIGKIHGDIKSSNGVSISLNR